LPAKPATIEKSQRGVFSRKRANACQLDFPFCHNEMLVSRQDSMHQTRAALKLSH
jgi:hypothetical protein